jgi:hypothetical protein
MLAMLPKSQYRGVKHEIPHSREVQNLPENFKDSLKIYYPKVD